MSDMIRFIGDIHGDMQEYYRIRELATKEGIIPNKSVQVGDFGVGFINSDLIFTDENHRFIRGNHDNPAECKTIRGWIPDGLHENGIMYVGGAWSIDRANRIEGVDWWPDEELSYSELSKVIDIYENNKPEIMVTHDCPKKAAESLIRFCSPHKGLVENRTQQALDAMLEIHRPKLWIFGHWHSDFSTKLDGTVFVCLGINNYIDVVYDTTNKKISLQKWPHIVL